MADRFPLILNTSINQIQEIASGDNLDLTGSGIHNAGVITATSFSGPIVAGAGTSNIVAGIITATQIDLNGDIDVDGHTNLDNVSVAGVTTFAGDIRTLNIFPAGSNLDIGSSSNPFRDIHLSNDLSLIDNGLLKLGTDNDFLILSTGNHNFIEGGSGFSGDLYIRAKLNQDGVKIISDGRVEISYSGTKKFQTNSGGVEIFGDLSVSGTVDGVDVSALNTTVGTKIANVVEDTSPELGGDLQSNGKHIRMDNNKYVYLGTDGFGIAGYASNQVYFEGNSTGQTLYIRPKLNQESIKAVPDGAVTLHHSGTARLATTSTGVDVTGNLSVSGVLTYEDVTNVDSVGIITARSSIKLDADGSSSSNFLSIGADDDLKIFHQSNVDKIESSANGFHIRQINGGDLHIHAGANTGSANNRLVARAGGKAELYYGGNLKLSTETGGVNITGVCTATTFVGALTGTASGNATISGNGDNRIITGGSGNALNGESSLTYDTYLGIVNSRSDTNFTDNSAPGGVNGMFIGNSQSTNGVYSAITLSANDGNGTNQNASLISKSVSGNYTPEFHITQRTANNTTETNFKITSNRSVELNYQGNKKLETQTNGVTVTGGAYFNTATSITGTPYKYLYGYTGADAKGVTIEGSESGLELVSSANGDHASSILLRNLNDGFAIINSNDSNQLQIRHFTASSDNFNAHGNGNGVSTLKTCATFSESSSVDLYWNNNLRLRTHEHGNIARGGANNVHIYLQTNDGTQRGEVYANNSNQVGFLDETGNWAVNFDRNGSSYCFSHFLPGTNDTYDLGATAVRWRNLYVNDLQLSNESKKDGGGNDVDGTWGDYTIQEGESDLFLINNRSGKKYKFNLTEVN